MVSIVLENDLSGTDSDYEDKNSSALNKIERLMEKYFKDLKRSQANLKAKFNKFKASVVDNLTEIRDEVSKLSEENVSLTKKVCTA